MVSGSTVNSALDQHNNLLRQYSSLLSGLTTWSGASRTKLDNNAAAFLEEYNKTITNQLTAFVNACNLYAKYIEEKNKYSWAANNYNTAVYNRDNPAVQTFGSEANNTTSNLNSLKTQINSLLAIASSPKLTAEKVDLSAFAITTSSSEEYPPSNKTLIPEVQQFLEQNRGKTVEIPKNIRKALGLQCEGLLSIPESYDASKAYPFLLWLVGTGHAGGDVNNLKTANFAKSLDSGRYKNDDALIYIPCRWGNGEQNCSIYHGSMLNNDLDQMINGLNVNMNAISGAGSSVGAFALAYLTTTHPNLFSTVALTGGGFGGSLNHAIKVDEAIQKSHDTTFIWFIANNDNSSKELVNGEYIGNGVHTYTLEQHQKMQAAGMNSIYYDAQGSLGHSVAVERFPTRALIHDLTHTRKGQTYSNIPSGVIQPSAQQTADSALDGTDGENTWYIPLS